MHRRYTDTDGKESVIGKITPYILDGLPYICGALEQYIGRPYALHEYSEPVDIDTPDNIGASECTLQYASYLDQCTVRIDLTVMIFPGLKIIQIHDHKVGDHIIRKLFKILLNLRCKSLFGQKPGQLIA